MTAVLIIILLVEFILGMLLMVFAQNAYNRLKLILDTVQMNMDLLKNLIEQLSKRK